MPFLGAGILALSQGPGLAVSTTCPSAPIWAVVVTVVGSAVVVVVFNRRRWVDINRRGRLRRVGLHYAGLGWVGVVVGVVGVAVLRGGLHVHGNPAAWVVAGLGAVLAPGKLIHHVVAHGAVFVVGFVVAALYVLVAWLACSFHLVAHQRAAHNAQRRGRCPARAAANRVANRPARNRPQDG